MKRSLYFLITLLLFSSTLQAQISASTADASDVTSYPVFPETDDIFIFCASDSLAEIGSLTVTTELQGTKTFLWEKYNEVSGTFELFFQESSEATSSQINNLADGCYRSTITLGGVTDIDRAWIFNNWTEAEASISDSNCESFWLHGAFQTAVLNYYDLSDNTEQEVYKDVQAEWQVDGNKISSLLNMQFFNPPYENTDYTLVVFDRFGCEGTSVAPYESIVTQAKFSVDANWTDSNKLTGEAPLTVTFINESENGSAGYYEWFFYRNMDDIIAESEGSPEPVDSIEFVAYDDSPVYTYQNSGAYWVKLVSKHVSELYTCVDTFALENYIIADTSFIRAPNVFTPNGDGNNDQFIVWFSSMKSLEINIYNRWGRRVHYWKSGSIQGFEGAKTESVWDGRIGGKYASPGVYYYDVVGRGRDGKKRTKSGFVHLFRNKD
ncbi:gliding motility-associated C-terminal domain-containing protein [Prolixibacteraceae bacterium Z1-6]|uniref:Gliding motility-associated C-terminal domain-containing protein n=1 Tax=Draconibacterium aestuarii TaxID=2998507 RepID=A0A9X3J3X8_9BACT|nr:gliding motility-associated C-terminal domain-containing protein [Prolixibacteraceae bacterium Z1-6]